MNRINYRSYRNVENLKYFNSNYIKNYCNQKLISCNGHIKFIKNVEVESWLDLSRKYSHTFWGGDRK